MWQNKSEGSSGFKQHGEEHWSFFIIISCNVTKCLISRMRHIFNECFESFSIIHPCSVDPAMADETLSSVPVALSCRSSLLIQTHVEVLFTAFMVGMMAFLFAAPMVPSKVNAISWQSLFHPTLMVMQSALQVHLCHCSTSSWHLPLWSS